MIALRSAIIAAVRLLAVNAAVAAGLDYNTPTGTKGLIMVDKVGGYVRFFDPTTLHEVPNSAFVPSPDQSIKPHEVVISPDHKFAYVSVYGDGVYGNNPHPGHTIAVIDLATRQMVASIDVSPSLAPHGLQITKDGMLYVSCDQSRKVLVIDTKKRQIDATIDTDGTGHWIALVPSVGKIYVSNRNDRRFVSVLDVRKRKMIGKVPMPNGSQGIVASPDGTKVLAADSAEPFLAVISPYTDAVVDRIRITGTERAIYKVFYSLNGLYVLTLTGDGQMNILDGHDLHAPQRIIKIGRNTMGFAFAPDGKTVILGNHSEGTASVIDLTTATITKIVAAGKGVETLAFY